MSEKKQLSVRLHGKQIGLLEQLITGKLAFTYDSDATESISYSMPLQENAHDNRTCEAYFGGLLPESHTAKRIIANQFGISANNSFALLKAIGYDCAGAISFHEINEPIIAHEPFMLEGKTIDESSLYAHIEALPKKPLFLGVEDLRLSLAGVQDKAAVCLIQKKIALPINGCPTTHILKPGIPAFENIVENEYMCLHIAKQIGLPIPDIEIRHAKNISYLLIQRYDRIVSKNTVMRIHQEDFCQALKINSAQKYQNEGGPGFKECFGLLKNMSQPAIDRSTLANALIFNFLIGNMDAHGKNFSLLHHHSSEISLAPFYDLVCTQYYPELSKKMSMKIGGEYEADRVQARDWEKLCAVTQYSYPLLKKLVKNQSELIHSAISENRNYYRDIAKGSDVADGLIKIITKNIERLVKKLDL